MDHNLIKKLKRLIFVGYGMEAILKGLLELVTDTIKDADPDEDIDYQLKLEQNLIRTLNEYKDRNTNDNRLESP